VPDLLYSAEDFNTTSTLEESNQGLLTGPALPSATVPEPATSLLSSLAGLALLAGLVSRRRTTGVCRA
jgi:hypothetical protein